MTTSTDTPAGRITRVYSAPEAILDGRHGVGADVFSLGCVFAEMAAVGVVGAKVLDLWEYVGIERVGISERECRFYCWGLDRLHKWFAKRNATSIEGTKGEQNGTTGTGRGVGGNGDASGCGKEGFYEKCIKRMVFEDRKDRPKASEVAAWMKDWFDGEELGKRCACGDDDGGGQVVNMSG